MSVDETDVKENIELKVSDDPAPASSDLPAQTSAEEQPSRYREWKKTQKRSSARVTPAVLLFLFAGSISLGMGVCGVFIMTQCALAGTKHHYTPAEVLVTFFCLAVALAGVAMISRGLMAFTKAQSK